MRSYARRCQTGGCLTSDLSPSWTTFADLLDPLPNAFLHDPVGWVDSRLGEFRWSMQCEVAESVRGNRCTAVPSCHDAGKATVRHASRHGGSTSILLAKHLS